MLPNVARLFCTLVLVHVIVCYHRINPAIAARSSALRAGRLDTNRVLAQWSAKADTLKCPFIRANSYKVLDAVQDSIGGGNIKVIPTMEGVDAHSDEPVTIDTVAKQILDDWKGPHNPYEGRGYYVTGALTRSIYQEDCRFDGPEPDMPVNGLTRFQRTVEQLFDQNSTRADLIRPLLVYRHLHTIKAYWRMEGRLHLPWLPKLKPWTGSTTYVINPATGRIHKHIEKWDISVCDAFLSALVPCVRLGSPPAPPLLPSQLETAQHLMYIE